mgnify:CR=1 FL=1
MKRLSEKIRALLTEGLDKVPGKLNEFSNSAREAQEAAKKAGDAVGKASDEFDEASASKKSGEAFTARIKQMLGI